jgi:hypothetical protein
VERLIVKITLKANGVMLVDFRPFTDDAGAVGGATFPLQQPPERVGSAARKREPIDPDFVDDPYPYVAECIAIFRAARFERRSIAN